MKLKTTIGFATLLLGLSFTAFGQNNLEKEKIISKTNVSKLQKLSKAQEKSYNQRKSEAIKLAKQKGLDVLKTLKDGRVAELQYIDRFGNPIYYVTTSNLNAAKTTNAFNLWSGGSAGLNLNGQNMTVGEWDGGPVRSTHQEFDSRVIQKDGVNFTSANGNNDHATHVAGTMMASGINSNAIGAAYQSTLWANDWNNDEAEVTSQAAQGLILSNHSYGYAAQFLSTYQFGYYDEQAATWDEITYNAPFFLPVKAAGNDRGRYNTGKSGYDLVTGFATSKNALVVAAVSAVTNYTGASSVNMSSFSSWGPTDDGRIKPDISGCGVGVFSTSSSGNTSYNTKSGTSMASPNVTGSLLLVQQHYKNLNNGDFMRSATLRGLAIHTANEAGSADGPDYRFGWGLLNAEKAVNLISSRGTSSIIDERTLTNNGTYALQVTATSSNPLEVTICWTDPKGTPVSGNQVDNGAIMLVNDLDVRVTNSAGATNFPWVLNPASPNSAATKGDNFRDNVEKVYIANPVAGQTYTISVSHKGSLQSGAQAYSLIVSGAVEGGSAPVCNVPSGLNATNLGNTTATLSWSAVSGASSYDLRYRAVGTSSWTNLNGLTSTSRNVSGLTVGTEYEFQVLTNCTDGSSVYSAGVTFTTTGGVVTPTYCDSKGNDSSYEWIAGVQVGSLNRTSGNDGGYSDQTAITVNLEQGSANAITLTPGFRSSTYNEYWKVWIDFNKDGDFEDAGELVFDAGSLSSSAVTGTLSIPSNAATGKTRMRVSMKYNGAQSSCETFTYGEVEDYSVNVTESATPACGVPTSLATSAVTTSSFTASWSAVTGASSYDLQVRTGGGNWSSFNATATSINLTGAAPSTTYELQVRANCSGASSEYSESVFVTTTAPALNYCDSKGNSVADEWIQRVRLGSIDNNSGSNGGYGDFTNLSTTLAKGNSYTITINPAWSGRTYREAYNVWVDYNQDGDFNDSGELVYSLGRTTSTQVSGSFTIPSSALGGATRMRVSMKYNANATPCETFSYGEVEDYTIVISTATEANLNPIVDTPVYATFEDGIENNAEFAFVAYPNPANSLLNVKLGYFGTDSDLVVYTITGTEILRTNISEQNTTLDISKLARGMYILSINSGREVETIKFIKE